MKPKKKQKPEMSTEEINKEWISRERLMAFINGERMGDLGNGMIILEKRVEDQE